MRGLASIVLAAAAMAAAGEQPAGPPDVLLVTLDTTRADAVGAATPVLEALAARGTRFTTAIAPAPLTLPSHATLLTALDPPAHGLRSNGGEVLPAGHPTLAEALGEGGRATAAVVGSRILDRRFGLARGFDHYDDRMQAEVIGEYGYPERDARAVTDAALAWLAGPGSERPFFLWVHYYDPHAPYIPPSPFEGAGDRAAYLGEVAFVDRQLGRLLEALPRGPEGTLVVVAGDHGEALGEHGERGHGIFLYRAALEVPLILAGPSVPKGLVIGEPVALRRVAPAVLRLAGQPGHALARQPGLPLAGGGSAPAGPVFAEATLPRTAYGWAPLRAVVAGGLKLVDAPRRELYDLAADPGEGRNLAADRPDDVDRLAALLDGWSGADNRRAETPELDPDTRAALRSLGYVGDGEPVSGDGLDPKDGIAILDELDGATRQLRRGEVEVAAARLAALVEHNPANGVLQTRYGEALLAAGDGDGAVAAYRAAVALRPHSAFAHRNLGEALLALGRADEARRAFQETVALDPRSAPGWLRLAELAPAGERTALLRRAVAAGTDSATIWLRLAEAELGSDPAAAFGSCRAASELAPGSAEAALCLGRAHLALGEPGRAAPHLRRASVLGRGTAVEDEAERLLGELSPRRESAPGGGDR
ncbi:MAG TPA: sulfatase-like hydrolase/transferase [Methylomirabilota bacterium]|nr:sulfatase-like hydrolase/transferase [Methylomirabilota bacterium]